MFCHGWDECADCNGFSTCAYVRCYAMDLTMILMMKKTML